MATIYWSNGKIEEVQPKNGIYFKLKELQAIVCGFIEVVYVKGGKALVLNEEGKLQGLPVNKQANLLYGHVFPGDYFVGNVLVCKAKEIK